MPFYFFEAVKRYTNEPIQLTIYSNGINIIVQNYKWIYLIKSLIKNKLLTKK